MCCSGYVDVEYLPFKMKDIYILGSYNGKSDYVFTSFESAVSNALKLLHKLHPESEKIYPYAKVGSLVDWIWVMVIIVLIIVMIKVI